MNEGKVFDRCVSVLGRQIDILKTIEEAQKSVRTAVVNREWIDFDAKIHEITTLGEALASLEDERLKLFPEGEDFAAYIAKFPLQESAELSRLYRAMKAQAFRVKIVNESFAAYLSEARSLTAAYLEAVCPSRGGKLYTRKGSKVSQDLKSMVVNNRL